MLALIFKNKVVEIADQGFPVAPTLIWVNIEKADPRPEVGWDYDGDKFSAPPEPVVDEKAEAKKKIQELHPKILEALADAVLEDKKDILRDLVIELKAEKAKLEVIA